MMIYSHWGGEKNKPTACISAAASRINSQGVKEEENPGRNCWMAKTNVSELGNVHSWLFLWCRAGGGGKPGHEECGRVAVDFIHGNLPSLNCAQSWNPKLLLFSLCWHLSQSFSAIAFLLQIIVGLWFQVEKSAPRKTGEKHAIAGFLMSVGWFISFWRRISNNACLERFHLFLCSNHSLRLLSWRSSCTDEAKSLVLSKHFWIPV